MKTIKAEQKNLQRISNLVNLKKLFQRAITSNNMPKTANSI